MSTWQMMISKDHERFAMVNNIVHKDQVNVNLRYFSVHLANHDYNYSV